MTDQPTTDTEQPVLAPEVTALALAAVAARVKKLTDPIRATFAGDYSNGSSQKFRSPIGSCGELGSVYRENPAPTWVVTDEHALHEHLAALGAATTDRELVNPADPRIVELIERHAPELLPELVAERTYVPGDVIESVLEATRAAGRAVDPDGNPVPGVKRVQLEGRLVVKPATNAGDVAAELARAGLIDWSTRPELSAGRRGRS